MVLLVHIGARIAYWIDEIVEERRAYKGHPDAHTKDSRTRYPYQELDPIPIVNAINHRKIDWPGDWNGHVRENAAQSPNGRGRSD